MKLFKYELCYIPYNKTSYQMAREEMAKITVREVNAIVTGATFLMIAEVNSLMAAINVAEFTEKLDRKGNEILKLIQIVGYWAAIVYAGIDIVKAFKKQDMAGLIAIALKYAVAVGILYGLPDIFDMVKDLFK